MADTQEQQPNAQAPRGPDPLVPPKLDDDPQFKELVANHSLAQLKEMLLPEDILGIEFIETKKMAAAAILTVRKRKAERAVPADPSTAAQAGTVPGGNPAAIKTSATQKREWSEKSKRMKELCAQGPKIRMMIPYDLGEKPGSYAELQINGYKLSVMKGVYVDLPEPFARLVEESWKQTSEAGQDIVLDRIDPQTGKPYRESPALL